MNKLTKAQEKRFDKEFDKAIKIHMAYLNKKEAVAKYLKQYLANELARERKKIIKKLEKIKNDVWINNNPESEYFEGQGYIEGLERAIKRIK